jgi:multiple sugar transport system substrate-binding protein
MNLNSLALPALALVVGLTVLASERLTAKHPPPGPVVITYWEKWTGFEGDAMRAVVDEFNRSQSRIRVEMLTVSGIGDKTMVATAGGNPPDVAGLFGPNVAQYADYNAVIPLDEYIERHAIREQDYIPAYWDIGKVRGRMYALPSTPASTALHFNKRMLRAAGWDPERPPRTIEELDALAERIAQRNAKGQLIVAGFMHSDPGWWNWGWGFIFGGRLWDGESKITVDDPASVRAWEWVQSYSKKYGSGELQTFRSGFGSFSSPQNGFISEKLAMQIQGVWMYNFIHRFNPDLEWAAAPFPHPADRPDLAYSTFVDSDVLVIPRGARHPDEAFEFIRFVQTRQAMEMLCMGQRKHTPLAEVSPEFLRDHPNPHIQLFIDLSKSPNAYGPAKIGLWPEFGAEMNSAYEEMVLMKKSPEEALRYVTRRMQPKLDEYLRRQNLRQAREASK